MEETNDFLERPGKSPVILTQLGRPVIVLNAIVDGQLLVWSFQFPPLHPHPTGAPALGQENNEMTH